MTVIAALVTAPTLKVAARLVEDTPGITRLMNTLTAKRYVLRRRCKEDRRQQLCSLTDRGRRLIDAVIPPVKATQEQIIGGLNRDEVLQLITLLRRLHGPTRSRINVERHAAR